MFDDKGRYIIENYNRQSAFSSFLPGISGLEGIPIWCFYVNRGQAIASFGIENKNHSIMEFYPAHQAYQMTKTMGFRTFLKIDGVYYEPFYSNEGKTKMYIGMNELEIEEINESLGIQINVLYHTLPNERLGGLVRKVTIQNHKKMDRQLEMLDGMPAIIPYGIELSSMKEMAQTMKAWMQVEDVDMKLPYYRVRYSTKDSASVSKIEEGNYFFAMTKQGERLPVIADADIIFEYDTSCQIPEGFLKYGLKAVLNKKQILQNQVPSGFAALEEKLTASKAITIISVTGQAANKNLYLDFASRCKRKDFFNKKYEQTVELTEKLSQRIKGKTGNKIFDGYCRQTYIDNILRGGYPINFGNNHIFYVYSRKHGDMERDYNFFQMLPEYYSQGNGNFRDVNQNRRSDVLFSPFTKDYNIKVFYNLIQLDGYNPLLVEKAAFRLNESSGICNYIEESQRNLVTEFFLKEFSPGELLQFLDKEDIHLYLEKKEFLTEVINSSTQQLNASFQEGYWVDHWTYNLDLIESYLAIYPDYEKHLLLEDNSYTYYEARAVVLPRLKRYVKTDIGIRQYHCIDEVRKQHIKHERVRTQHGNGAVYTSNLLTKLLVIIQNRFASLDMYGMGVEMEGGKPGWYDAMNGLPGIFGSSMAESYELLRLLKYVVKVVERYQAEADIFQELFDFMVRTGKVMKTYFTQGKDNMWVWNKLNELKEEYREQTVWGIDEKRHILTYNELLKLLKCYISYTEEGIQKAIEAGNGICPTYFAYEMTKYKIIDEQVIPECFQQIEMPLFLEGFVRYLKLPISLEKKRHLYEKIKKSTLYDKKLRMYKVNESLEKTSFEVGRAKAFSPGWLENESIWLHMEYKYLLQLLSNGLYTEFYEDFWHACIPFLDFGAYGRSILENSSFIVSSANLNERIHGKGFVARLSGSTAEFLQMWQIMMFGEKPFRVVNDKLICVLEPAIPIYLIAEDKTIEATFLGSIKVIYRLNKKKALIPTQYSVENIVVKFMDGTEEYFVGQITGEAVKDIRNERVTEIVCYVEL
ncbi:hypothetical protein [Lachnotalea glycerini]|uniref:Cellobiose phosphorylase n=1 Tax=Lachnotalea glycerini TaxID=1763509 RepID=A0A371JG10_9FIRM|nr:hypothetical protein [Lachnotalea glycerini]RDY31680.1 hypothetical protein CG710_008145 [Lachnotalea glycerini]